jgi:hypothetical protein
MNKGKSEAHSIDEKDKIADEKIKEQHDGKFFG